MPIDLPPTFASLATALPLPVWLLGAFATVYVLLISVAALVAALASDGSRRRDAREALRLLLHEGPSKPR